MTPAGALKGIGTSGQTLIETVNVLLILILTGGAGWALSQSLWRSIRCDHLAFDSAIEALLMRDQPGSSILKLPAACPAKKHRIEVRPLDSIPIAEWK